MATSTPQVRPRSRVTVAHYPPGVTWGPRVMTDFEVVWVLSGSARWSVRPPGADSQQVRLAPGTLALSRPGVEESYAWDRSRHSTHAFVHFTVDRPEQLAPLHRWPLTTSMKTNPVLAGLCDHLVRLSDLASDDAQTRSQELLALLVGLVVAGPLPERGSDISSPVVAAALQTVRQRWQAQGPAIVPVGEIAAGVGVSSGHLAREFHKQFRTGIAGALEIVRLASAAITLQRTNLNLAEVADATGFADAYHFSHRFSTAYGEPPGRFRRRHGADPLGPLERAGLGPVWSATLGAA